MWLNSIFHSYNERKLEMSRTWFCGKDDRLPNIVLVSEPSRAKLKSKSSLNNM